MSYNYWAGFFTGTVSLIFTQAAMNGITWAWLGTVAVCVVGVALKKEDS